MKFKLFGDSSLLSLADHIEGKLFKDSVIPKGIGLGYNASVRRRLSEAKMIRSFSMGCNDVYKFAKGRTASKLSEYKHTKKVPVSECPTCRSVVVSAENTVELTLERRGYLLKHVSS